MARFNKNKQPQRPTATNRAGGTAFEHDAKFKLASLIGSSMLKGTFYRKGSDEMDEIQRLAREVDPLFAAKAAIYTRHKLNMRSTSHVLAGELAATGATKGEAWGSRFYEKVVVRPDDILEILAYLFGRKGRRFLPAAIRKGFGRRLRRFDDYQLAKYKGLNKDINLFDAVNLIRPKGTDSLDRLMSGTLKPAQSKESVISAAGPSKKAKAEAWGKLVGEGRIGYMALLKSLVKILDEAPEMVDQACVILRDGKRIAKQRILPHRYIDAYDAVASRSGADARIILQAISDAVDMAIPNLELSGRTLVAVDRSSSMSSGSLRYACLFAAIIAKATNADIIAFNGYAGYVPYTPDQGVMSLAKYLMSQCSPLGGTNHSAAFEKIDGKVDRIVYLSDEQGWLPNPRAGVSGGAMAAMKSYKTYCRRAMCAPEVYSVDLCGYGTSQFGPGSKVKHFFGLSWEPLEVMAKVKEDPATDMIKEIEKVEI